MNMIVAVDKNWGIGKNNKLLAHIKSDLKYFKEVTKNNIVVMGYNTYLSLPIRPLPNRINIVLTRKDISLENTHVVNSIDGLFELLEEIKGDKEVFICGGASIYEQFLPLSEKLYITHIFHEFDSDVYFPNVNEDWEIYESKCSRENIEHKYPHVFTVYKRKNK